jgi:hypothetical protein
MERTVAAGQGCFVYDKFGINAFDIDGRPHRPHPRTVRRIRQGDDNVKSFIIGKGGGGLTAGFI